MRLRWKNERGDTMVEVLIAIAIVSLVLASAYVITNKNTLAIQANQERIQAQHLVESQIESLRGYIGSSTPPTTANFCFNSDSIAPTDGTCIINGVAGSGADYTLVIASPNNSFPGGAPCDAPSTTAYAVCAYWDSLDTNNANASLTMYYRVQ